MIKIGCFFFLDAGRNLQSRTPPNMAAKAFYEGKKSIFLGGVTSAGNFPGASGVLKSRILTFPGASGVLKSQILGFSGAFER